MMKLKSIQVGLLYSLIGIAVGVYIALTAIGNGYEFFPLYAGFAGFLTYSIFWWMIVERKNSISIFRGIISGCLSGVISHYICWYLILFVANIQYLLFGTGLSSLGEPPQNLLESFYGAAVYTIWSLIFFGWLTVPAGGLIGGFYARHLKKST